MSIEYSSRSNNNRYTYKMYREQIQIQSYNDKNASASCLGGLTGSFSVGKFDKLIAKLYANKTANGNNHWNANEELYTFFLNYIKELFPIFTWAVEEDGKDMVIKLTFSFDQVANTTECNQMKLICNLARRLYESPRSYELQHAYFLYKENWHNLDFYQILLAAEITEYVSTNDHKLIPFMVSILPTGKEVAHRTTEISGIYNSNMMKCEVSKGYGVSLTLPHNFNPYPKSFTPAVLEQFEAIFKQANEKRKFLNLNEL